MRFDEKVHCGEDCIFVFLSKINYNVRRENTAVSKTYLFEKLVNYLISLFFLKILQRLIKNNYIV